MLIFRRDFALTLTLAAAGFLSAATLSAQRPAPSRPLASSEYLYQDLQTLAM